MKLFILSILFSLLSSFIFAQTFELYNNDTINYTDASGQKQGRWIIFNTSKSQISEEGNYTNNKKEGIWKKFYDNGKLKHELTFKGNKPDGYAKFYYETGIVSEEGLWKNNKWVGGYKYFFENGNLSYEWSYNEQGKRSGEQKYYHPNGKIMIEGDWQEGKESGIIKEYDEAGNLKAEKNYNNGLLDANSVKIYDSKATSKVTENINKVNDNNNTTNVSKQNNNVETKSMGIFTGSGFNKLYTKEGKIEQEGDFENGILIKGKKFYYDEKSNLVKTAIIKDGRVFNIIYEDKK